MAGVAGDRFLKHSIESERAFPFLYGITPKWVEAGGLLQTSIRRMLNRRTESARLYERTP